MTRRFSTGIALAILLSWTGVAQQARGCPFCTAVSKTLSEEIDTAEVAVIARLTSIPHPGGSSTGPGDAAPMAKFAIDQVLKGKDRLGKTTSVSTVFFGEARVGDHFLMLGNNPPELTWSPPMKLTQPQREYVLRLITLPASGAKRLVFFQQYLEDKDALLSRDAYDEFARAPYSDVKALKPQMDHDQLVSWIADPNVPASRRRLYLTMLGVCGSVDDIQLVEERLRATDAQSKSGLDAAIACYLTLRGPEGVELIEDLFLKKKEGNFSDNYADVYAAIMALRFHGTESDIVPRQRVLEAFGHLLSNPQMADLVISDMARWEDWSQLDRLIALFSSADPKASWVRIPIINYARACPLPEAKKALESFEKIDADAVKRAMTFFPSITSQGTK